MSEGAYLAAEALETNLGSFCLVYDFQEVDSKLEETVTETEYKKPGSPQMLKTWQTREADSRLIGIAALFYSSKHTSQAFIGVNQGNLYIGYRAEGEEESSEMINIGSKMDAVHSSTQNLDFDIDALVDELLDSYIKSAYSFVTTGNPSPRAGPAFLQSTRSDYLVLFSRLDAILSIAEMLRESVDDSRDSEDSPSERPQDWQIADTATEMPALTSQESGGYQSVSDEYSQVQTGKKPKKRGLLGLFRRKKD